MNTMNPSIINHSIQKIAKFILAGLGILCVGLPQLQAQNPDHATVFKRILSAQFYHNHQWVLENTSLADAIEVLKSIKPSYVSGLMYFDAAHSPNSAQIAAFKAVREALPEARLDIVLNPNDYKKPEELVAKMKSIEAALNPDIWYFDFKASSFKASAKHLSEAIAYAHTQGKLIGGNQTEKTLLKEGDFVAVYDGRKIDLDFREDINKLLDNKQLTVLFQINNDSNRSTDDTVHTFIKKWKTHERTEHIKRLARNQNSWKYRLMYPVFFPVFLNKQAYQAQQDGDTLKIFEELMTIHN